MTTLDQKIVEIICGWQPNGWPWGNFILCVCAILLTVLFCGILGIEREMRGGTTGLTTLLLVGVGSCVIMIISIYGFPASNPGDRDVARLAAQIVSGIGFLGTGAIIYTGGGIKGLTTASTIWLSMAMGLSFGSFNFILGLSVSILSLLLIFIMYRLEKKVAHNLEHIVVYAKPETAALSLILQNAEMTGLTVIDISSEINKDSSEPRLEISFRVKEKKAKTDENLFKFIENLEKNEGILNVQMVHRP